MCFGLAAPFISARRVGPRRGEVHPLDQESMPNHIGSAKNALLGHIAGTDDASFVDGKMIFLQGSPELAKTPGGVHLGRLSGIGGAPRAVLLAGEPPSFLGDQLHRRLGNQGRRGRA